MISPGYLLKRCTVALLLAGACAISMAGEGAADLILTGGKIKTSHGWVDALAVRHGVIIAVGDAKSVESLRTSTTRTLNLAGQTVLPGLHDVHVHPIFAGLSERRCRISQGSTLKQTEKQVRECVARSVAGAWLTGGQWDASALGGIPNRAVLDRVAPNNPVLLEDTSGHSAWANSKALAIAGLTRGVPNPTNGIIERGKSGEPTGILRESAIDLVKQHIPGPTQAEVNAALTWSLGEMLATGLTSFTEAAVGFSAGAEKELQAYAELADAGVLKQRVRLCLTWSPDEHFESLLATRNRFMRERVKPDCVKIFLDGVPTDSHTAAMLHPYAGTIPGRTDEAARKGLLLVDPAQLNAAVTRFDRMGLVVKFHAAGDAAVRAGLDAIEAARKANGFGSQMHNVGHSTFVAREDIARARAMGATFEVSPYLWGPTPINDDITAAVGPEVIKRVWPVREMIDSGALVVPGSDWSVVPSVNPWVGIETLVTREKPGGSSQSFGKSEAITLQEAFDLFTANSARQEGAADRIGSIDTGMVADLIVVDRDPFAIPIRDVHSVQVRQTIIGGEVVYGAEAPAAAAAAAKGASSDGQWLMVVKTNGTDPKREAQFNEWYDKIDVPDVLEVPGYLRARRGVKTEPGQDQAQDGKYIAIYNMEGPSIDKIIIEMLMATRKMEERGRSTDLLKVVERDYYREYAAPSRANGDSAGGSHEYLYVLRFDCNEDPERQAAFNRWHDGTLLPGILRAKGVTQAARYELYRVLMTEPKAVPRYLTLVELRADTPEQARDRMQEVLKALPEHEGAATFAGDVHAYAKINDVSRTPPRDLRVEAFAGDFATVNSFVISNGQSLLVLDAQRKSIEAQKLADRIHALKLPLAYIFISHGHTDHFTGMALLHREFPDAQIIVASEAIRQDIKNYAIYMDQGGQTGAEPALEAALRPRSAENPGGFDYENWIHVLPSSTLALRGGGTLELTTDYPPTEAPHMTTVYCKELNALFLADFGYNQVHLWMGDDIDRKRIAAWRAELLRIKARYAPLNPVVYPGHGQPTDMALLDRTVSYIDDFTRVTAAAKSREEAKTAMQALYPTYQQADFFLKYSVENHVK